MNDEKDMENKIIRTQDENGEIYSFELIDVVEFNGQEYGLLVHVPEEGEEPKKTCECAECDHEHEDDEEEVVIMRLNKEDDSYVFETIEDDEEFNNLIEYIEAEEDEDDEEE
jgi:hypothetical protein